jgi:hypothetical protein
MSADLVGGCEKSRIGVCPPKFFLGVFCPPRVPDEESVPMFSKFSGSVLESEERFGSDVRPLGVVEGFVGNVFSGSVF